MTDELLVGVLVQVLSLICRVSGNERKECENGGRFDRHDSVYGPELV